jgi:hypothetical protein
MQMGMLDELDRVIGENLPQLLRPENRHLWRSVHVTYHPPRVERLWMQVDERHRLFLHRIHPCEEKEALFHPHPWPSAVRIVSGRYEMRLSSEFFPEDEDETRTGPAWTSEHAKMILGPGSVYEMTDRQGWHSVRPLDGPSDSIMLVGPLYEPTVEMPSPPTEKQGPLAPKRVEELMSTWHDRIDQPVECYGCGWKGRHSELECYRNDDGCPVEMEHVRCPNCFDEDQVGSR